MAEQSNALWLQVVSWKAWPWVLSHFVFGEREVGGLALG